MITGSFNDSTYFDFGDTTQLLIPGISTAEPILGLNGIILRADVNGSILAHHQIRSLGSVDGVSSKDRYGNG